MPRASIVGLLFLFLTPVSGRAQSAYEPSEWESFTVTRYARQVVPGTRWVGVLTDAGVLFYDRLRDRWTPPLTPADGLPGGRAEALWMSADGIFVYSTGTDQVTIEPGSGQVHRSSRESPPEVLREPLPDNLFAGSEFQYLPDGRLVGPPGEEAIITDCRSDDEGYLWITTWGLGTGRAQERTRRLRMHPHGLWSPEVRALLVDGDRILAGGYGDPLAVGGLTEWRMSTGEWTYLLAFDTPGLLSDRITALAQAGDDLWLGTDLGLTRCSAAGRWRSWGRGQGLPESRVTALAAGDGAVWIGTMHGAAVAAGDSISRLPGFELQRVEDVASGGGGIWWATENGALVWSGGWPQGRLEPVTHPRGWLSGRVDAVWARGDTVWWATPRGVIAGLPRTGEWLEIPPGGPFLPGEIIAHRLRETNRRVDPIPLDHPIDVEFERVEARSIGW